MNQQYCQLTGSKNERVTLRDDGAFNFVTQTVTMTIREAKEIDLVEYLSGLGYEPAEKRGNVYWYHSMLPGREEKTPSFKINRRMNRWYDWGDAKGGNLVDFGVFYYGCSVTEFLQKLGTGISAMRITMPVADHQQNLEEDSKLTILGAGKISSLPLFKYLQTRCIPRTIADQYLSEVRYQIKDRNYYALGFKNDAGGYELRNAHFKGSSSPKDTTFIDNDSDTLCVFEGFFNFLSYRMMDLHKKDSEPNFLILNTTSFFKKSLTKMQAHKEVKLFLDNDKTGDKNIIKALAIDKLKFKDPRSFYSGYNDLNEWLIKNDNRQYQQLRHRL